ncbi:MAG: D-alanine--D-alanine ligase [Candidatus Tectimicrobiota bacterium]|nr:MAG: D-alanine--D-alanine ligase [Candidatus Tectomicrobia bacterium]
MRWSASATCGSWRRAWWRGARWDLVFNIAEGLHGFAREAQVPALLEAYGVPYTFSDPLVLALALHKALTKAVLRAHGVPTPDFAVVHTPAEVDELALPYPLFAKPVAEGTSKGISAANTVYTPAELRRLCTTLLATYRQPVLVETFLPGREFTVGLLGTGAQARVLGVMEVTLLPQAEPGAYSYANKADYLDRVAYRLADDAVAQRAAAVALQAWRLLGCRDAGRVDLRCTAAGEPQFLEVNPLAGLHPQHSDLPILCRLRGIDYGQLIAMILAAACQRLALPWPLATVEAR